MDSELFEIERGNLELDPGRDGGKTSVGSITHSMFFFGIGEEAFNRSGTKSIGLLAYQRVLDVLCLLEIVLPYVSSERMILFNTRFFR